MACFNPLQAFQSAGGLISFSELRRNGDSVKSLLLPCGQCAGCRLERSRQWAMRCTHEAKMHKRNCFLTLTYDDEHLPQDHSLDYRHFQLFMKRLRKRFRGSVVRFYMCGEYGENFGRPHYHACIFGIDFDDKVLISRPDAKHRLFRSSLLESLWGFGFCSIGEVTFDSAAYVARYIMKKVTGDAADGHYRAVDLSTGEIHSRTPEFNHMSLKPGIGATFYEKYKTDVFPHDYVVVNGRKVSPPKYYFKRLKKADPDAHSEIYARRELDTYRNREDNTPARLEVKKEVTDARLNLYRRSIT